MNSKNGTNEPLILRNSKKKYFLSLLICAVFVFIGIWILRTDASTKAQLIGWCNAGFFGLGALVLVRQLFDSRPRITITETGITDRTLNLGEIEWADIEDALLMRIQREHFIALKLRDEQKYLSRLSSTHQGLASANTAFGFNRINVNLSGVDCNPRVILDLIAERVDIENESEKS